MDLDRAVLVVTTAGENLLGERHKNFSREDFNTAAQDPGVVLLQDARLFVSHTVPMSQPDGAGRTLVKTMFDLTPIGPLTTPARVVWVRPSRWVHLEDCDDPSMKDMLRRLLKHTEDREMEIRASAAGIQLSPGIAGSKS